MSASLNSILPSSFCSFKLSSDNYGPEGGLSDPGPAFIGVGTEAWAVTQQCVAELRGQSLDDMLLLHGKNKHGKSHTSPYGSSIMCSVFKKKKKQRSLAHS